jgi:hypothetical protein
MLKVKFIWLPIVVTATTMATEINAVIKPYSMAVTPLFDRSAKAEPTILAKFLARFLMRPIHCLIVPAAPPIPLNNIAGTLQAPYRGGNLACPPTPGAPPTEILLPKTPRL